jgi:hypothetical protein
VLSWADVTTTHTLRDGDLPMPSVTWRAGDFALEIAAFGDGTSDAAQALARYSVRNLSKRERRVTLALAWRPFQANPPTQFLANPGGASPIDDLAWDGRALSVNGVPRLIPLAAPAAVRLEPLANGPVGDWAAEAGPPAAPARVVDAAGFASAVLSFPLRLRPGERRDVAVALPVRGALRRSTAADFATAEARAAVHWRDRLDRVRIEGPAEVEDIARTLRTALGHILVNRSGPALQPGPRAYARSWIRDGALTSSALLRLGQDDVVRDFLLWYAPFQFANGKVPCCATERGADPVPENDSDGEFAFAVADLWQYTIDDGTARTLWPHVRRAIEHMEALRVSERMPANLAAGRRAYFGMMPPSISHEGYSDQPAYSYWDNFWAAIGYRSAQSLAVALGFPDDARASRASARSSSPTCWPRSPPARGATGSTCCRVPPTAATSIRPRAPSRSAPGGLLGTLPDCPRAQHLRSLLALVRRAPRQRQAMGRIHAIRVAQRRRSRAARPARACARSACLFPTRSAARRAGTSGPRSCCAMRASRAFSATCRMAGSHPTRSARCSTCSPTSTKASGRWCWRPACRSPGSTAPG